MTMSKKVPHSYTLGHRDGFLLWLNNSRKYREINENNEVKYRVTANKTTSLQVKVVSCNLTLLLPVT